MFENITHQIRQKSRAQYRDRAFEIVTDIRIWIQENPERAFICALVGGMMFVLLFKVFLVLIAVAVLCGVLVWTVALPEGIPLTPPPSVTDDISLAVPSESMNGHPENESDSSESPPV